MIYDTFTQATGDTRRFNDNCSHCILSLLQDCGKIYFRDMEELERMRTSDKAVDVSTEPVKPVRKAKVKTTKKAK